MANPFQQKVRIRKLIYTGLILALFTASLLHRRFQVEPMAEALQLRESARGEVELTSSAVRLTLTGSRGLAVTGLWWLALKEQDRHKWNEVELLVGSITKLQPYFITPWLFQGWNLAFNVAVESDKPRDKYYYVSRGLQLLAEGERRNQGKLDDKGQSRFPGNPDMRHSLGFFYQLKIGTSDEKHAMGCLLDLSCIDPVKREPSLFAGAGQEVNLKELEDFCRKNPRLVRRLREDLEYDTPRKIVGYLKDNYVVPSRFSERKELSGASIPEDPHKQFPIVPPPQDVSYPDPETRDFSRESVDAFLISRTWTRYAQLPLPDPEPDPGAKELTYDPVKQRLPKHMTTMIFRGQPQRAQAYIAERLEEEGWFDDDGWLIGEWFDAVKGPDEEVRVGDREPKYHADRAWADTHKAYEDFGKKNGLLLTLEERQRLELKAEKFRKKYNLGPGDRRVIRPDDSDAEMKESAFAHLKLAWNAHYLNLTNYEAHLLEAEAMGDPQAVKAKKLLFYGNQRKRAGESPRALAYFEKAIPEWLNVLLRYPNYAADPTVQEDSYEQELHYLRLLQGERSSFLRPFALGMAQLASWPHWPWEHLLTPTDKKGIIPIRKFRGPLDALVVYQVMQPQELKRTLLQWSQAGLPLPNPFYSSMLVCTGKENLLLTSTGFLVEPKPGTQWNYLISSDAVRLVRDRLGVNRRPQ
jgi:hypothetical protein